jgi:hypothetical protein
MAGQCVDQRYSRSLCARQRHHPLMKRSIRCVTASPQSGVIAIGTDDGHIYPIPTRTR